MKAIIKIILMMLFISSIAHGIMASHGVKTFTQPDGTTFKGILKGNSAFHWIESHGEIIKYNKKDKFYYKAIITEDNKLVITDSKPNSGSKRAISRNGLKPNIHNIDAETRKKLLRYQRESRRNM